MIETLTGGPVPATALSDREEVAAARSRGRGRDAWTAENAATCPALPPPSPMLIPRIFGAFWGLETLLEGGGR